MHNLEVHHTPCMCSTFGFSRSSLIQTRIKHKDKRVLRQYLKFHQSNGKPSPNGTSGSHVRRWMMISSCNANIILEGQTHPQVSMLQDAVSFLQQRCSACSLVAADDAMVDVSRLAFLIADIRKKENLSGTCNNISCVFEVV